MIDRHFWKDKRVFITGHTGFKGSWLSMWLHSLGAKVTGYALPPPTEPSLFNLCRIDDLVDSRISDIRDVNELNTVMQAVQPEIVIHMAAQPLVLESYKYPAETYSINVMGTVNLFETVRKSKSVRVVVNVTTDKCYENKEWVWPYRENEPLGGYDPYSSSKACSELVTSAFRSSFFNPKDYGSHGVGIASARAGNVIGGGDWSDNRLVPDCVRAFLSGEKILIRNPRYIRPWQHVLEPLSGYLILSQKLFEDGEGFSEGWNFGPSEDDAKEVEWVVKNLCYKWGEGACYEIESTGYPHEANYLKLDCSKARARLGWRPKWDLERTLDSIIDWTRAYKDKKDLRELSMKQIEDFTCGRKG